MYQATSYYTVQLKTAERKSRSMQLLLSVVITCMCMSQGVFIIDCVHNKYKIQVLETDHTYILHTYIHTYVHTRSTCTK